MAGFRATSLFPTMPAIHFYPEQGSTCPHCGSTLNVRKTSRKKVVTLAIGGFYAIEHVLECSVDQKVFTSQELRALRPKGGTYGYDILVYVGYALFVHFRSEREVLNDLAARNISISEREISYLGMKFIIYLALAHRESREHLRRLMAKKGGYILHLDGTCEGDSPFLFTGLDGISKLVLANIKIPSEKKDLIVPFLQQVKEHYGDPIALVHDMGKGIIAAVEEVFEHVLDFICHFHFLRDIGKDLFDKEYSKIRNLLKKHQIRTQLRQKAKYCEKLMGEHVKVFQDLEASIINGRIEAQDLQNVPAASAYALIHWAFDLSDQLQGYGFPFDRPHLVFYQRLAQVHEVLKEIKDIRLRNNTKDNSPFYKLWRQLSKVMNDKELKKAVQAMEEKNKVFDELRKALSIALVQGTNGLNDDGADEDIRTIEEKVKAFRIWITTDESYSKMKDYQKMIRQIDKYWDKLFADPIYVDTPDGIIAIQPQRTNNALERLFRYYKKGNRKKSGTVNLSRTLKTMLADTPLVNNLENEDYMQIILDGCSTLEERFSRIDSKLVREELKRAKENPEKIPQELKKIIKNQKLPQKITQLFKSRAR